jgi:hypothetical protein
MTTDDRQQQVFQRILTREGGVDVDAGAVAAAARRTCEHLARQLAPLVGEGGVAAIYTRSLHLVQRQFPGLAPGRESAQRDGPFVRVEQFLAHQQPAVASAAAVALFTTVGELLASFIGEPLTMRLLREAWPVEFASDTTEETIT